MPHDSSGFFQRRPFRAHRRDTKLSRRAARTALMILIWCAVLWSSTTLAQNIKSPESTVDYKQHGASHVDPATLAMQLQIPLGNYAGRGGANLPVTLSYSSKLWRMVHLRTDPNNGEPDSIYRAMYTRSTAAGWTSSLDWFNRPSERGIYYFGAENPLEKYDLSGNPLDGPTYVRTVARMHVVLPGGARHELRRNDTVLNAGSDTTSGTFYAVDGSRLRYESVSNTLFMPDGSRYVLGQNPQYIDSNGNTLSYNSATGQWTDTLGRSFASPPLSTSASADYTYTLPGAGGTSLAYIFRWRNLSDVRTDPSRPLRYKGDRTSARPHLNVSPSLFGTFDDQHSVTSDGSLFKVPACHRPRMMSSM